MFVGVDMSSHVRSTSLDISLSLLVGVHRPLLVQFLLVLGKHVLLVLAGDDRGGSVDMFSGEALLVLDGLDSVLRNCVSTEVAATWEKRQSLDPLARLTWWWWTCFSLSMASAVSTCS